MGSSTAKVTMSGRWQRRASPGHAAARRPGAAARPLDAVIALTHHCNGRCVMCGAWRSPGCDALEPHHMGKLPAGLRTVNLSGGEPFGRDDLPQFVREVRQRCPGAQIAISTSAMSPDRVVGAMDEIRRIDPSVRLAVSLDGMGPAHDRVRGVAGAFDSAVSVIDRLQADGYDGLRLSMTLTDVNLDELPGVADFAAGRGLELGIVATHACEVHLGTDRELRGPVPPELGPALARAIRRWLCSMQPKQWLRAHFAYHVYSRLVGRGWLCPCGAASGFFFLQADGMVYSCGARGQAMGNLLEQDWAAIWHGPAARRARSFAASCRRGCWMICTARSVYRAHPWAVLGWILVHKLPAHLGLLAMPTANGSPVAEPQEAVRADLTR